MNLIYWKIFFIMMELYRILRMQMEGNKLKAPIQGLLLVINLTAVVSYS